MRNLNNLDEMMDLFVEAEAPVRAILADEEVKKLWRGGSYLDVIFCLFREHRAGLYAVIAALDGEVGGEEVAEKYSLTDVIRLFTEIVRCEEFRELIALFTSAGKKKGAVSSGSPTANTGA